MEPGRVIVLVVDPQPVYSALVSLTLAESGIVTLQASTAADALALMEAHPPALVLAEYALPGADGIDLLESTRERRPDVPFVVWSGSLSEAVTQRARELGAHVTSKLAGEQLRGLVRSLLGEAGDGDQAVRGDRLG